MSVKIIQEQSRNRQENINYWYKNKDVKLLYKTQN